MRGIRFVMLLLLLLTAGCSGGNDMAELEQFVEEVISRPPGPIEPLPSFVSYQPFTYSAANLRSPFAAPEEALAADQSQLDRQVQPDENRPREALEAFSIGSLQMVGSLSRGNTLWALVREETGQVHRVMEGNYMGKNHGRVVAITPQRIDLMEIVPSGDGGWIERPQTLALHSTQEE